METNKINPALAKKSKGEMGVNFNQGNYKNKYLLVFNVTLTLVP